MAVTKRSTARSLIASAALGAALAITPTAASADAPKVVASIKPVHSLVTAVMDGIAEPGLLVRGGASPHTYSLRPSEAQMLSEADVVFWVGIGIETFLPRALDSLAQDAVVVELQKLDGIVHVPARVGGAWEEHTHDHNGHDHDGDGHDDHGHDGHVHGHDSHGHDDHGHGHDSHGHDDHGHGHGHGHNDHGHEHEREHDDAHPHAHGETNPHIWMDPRNAIVIVNAVAETLGRVDPSNADAYLANARQVKERLEGLDAELAERLALVAGKPFIVFHDAYQHLEARYDLNAVGSVTVSPEHRPGARRLSELRARIQELGSVCLFREPQFSPAVVHTIAEGTEARVGTLDPLGAELADGPDLYFELMRFNADALVDCLAG